MVVTEDTIRDAEMFNKQRSDKGLNPIILESVSLLKEEKSAINFYSEDKEKISSCNYRIRVLGTLHQTPQVN